MLSDKVAQNPTIPVNDGKKNVQKSLLLLNLDGCASIGPNPCPAEIAQPNNANAAAGKKNALNTNNFLMLSTPKYTTYMFTSQNNRNINAGPVCNDHDAGNICGNESMDGIQSLT